MRATREKCSSLLNYVFDLCQQLSSILMADGQPSCYVLLLGRIQGCIPNYEYNILHGPSISPGFPRMTFSRVQGLFWRIPLLMIGYSLVSCVSPLLGSY